VTLAQLREAAQGCRGCQLYKRATQAVFGEGPAHANLMFVGEQPGDQEDLTGHVFVGPAGGVLRRAMDEAGIAPGKVYITNAVKHFKWEPSPRGKRRIHARPNTIEMRACFGWLEREVEIVRPRLLVLLGATAAQAVLGTAFRVSRERGRLLEEEKLGTRVMATVHPSSILRAQTDAERRAQYAEFVADLRVAARHAG
jgi:DNA polymerase